MHMIRSMVALLCVLALAACGGSAPATGGTTDDQAPSAVASAAPSAAASEASDAEPSVQASEESETEPSAAPSEAGEAAPSTAPSAAADSSDQADAAVNDAEQAIIDAVQAQLARGSYRSQATVEAATGTNEMTVEMVLPDKARITAEAQGVSTETVIIGDESWIKVNDAWTKVPANAGVGNAMESLRQDPEQLARVIESAELVGTEDVNGTAAKVYTYTTDATEGGISVSQEAKIWISEADGLPLKQESTITTQGSTSKISQTYDYDTNITIEPPTE